ncbi:helix-turn-helix domain-containing protein [Georgenia sp. H159]|uniref:helix-turn-helix domain-containing protein n=1 Tax=Georgenia sp. H159 TaxID=3076115 RepID=UPI002D767B1F|nr:helix-turn-helix domain-containing protein [Georgenia sp. H159]
MPYPSRPILDPLAPFKYDLKNGYNRFQRDRFDAFVAQQYTAGLSLRQVAELTGRTQAAVRSSLDRSGIPRRGRGAPRLSQTPKH